MTTAEGLHFPVGYETHLARMAKISAEGAGDGLALLRYRYDLWGERLARGYPREMRVRDSVAPLPGREIPVRFYWPADLGPNPPVIVFFHGGGFVAGGIASHDHITWALAQEARAVLVSVQYRRPPENPFPAPQDDCYAALDWVVANASLFGYDASRLSVAGDSAGGLLSTAICMMARDRQGPLIRHQALLYGVFDMDMDRPYYKTAKDALLTLPMMREFSASYLPGGLAGAPATAVPLRAARDELSGLPPALLVNGEYDVLLQEEQEYAQLLRSSGVPTREILVKGVMHGFLRAWDLCPEVHTALIETAAEIRQHLA